MMQVPEGFLVDRIVGPLESEQGVVRYHFQVDMGLNLYIAQEAEMDSAYLEMSLDSGIRTLAKTMIKRGNEILGLSDE